MKDLVIDYIVQNFAMYFLIAAFFAIVVNAKMTRGQNLRYIVYSICIAIALSIITSLETWTAEDPELITARTWLSYLGFCLRPASILALILAIENRTGRRVGLFIPEICNILLLTPCFFTDKVFTFDESYTFQRGPLGYVIFVTTGIYFLYFLYMVIRNRHNGKRREFIILSICSIWAVLAVLSDVFFYGTNINISIIICCLFYYLFLNSTYSGRDVLTGLQSRNAFYEDAAWRPHTITAVATIDMNGLKERNDRHGHASGDAALTAIGHVLDAYTSRTFASYRVGGDEFMAIFRNTCEDDVLRILNEVKFRLVAYGVQIAVGYAASSGETFEELCRKSDEAMYADKRNYYRTTAEDRKSR